MSKRHKATKAEWADLTIALRQRCAGRCEFCGRRFTTAPGMGVVIHHRRLRSQQGGDTMANLVMVHENCHLRCHRFVTQAREWGWIVPSWQEPADVPVQVIRPSAWDSERPQ